MAIASHSDFAVDLSDTAVLPPAEGSLWSTVGYGHSIDAHASGIDALRHLHAFTLVFGPEAGAQPVFGIIGHANRFLFIAHAHNRHDRPKGLIGHDKHIMGDIGEHGGLVIESFQVWVAASPKKHLGTLGHRIGYMLLNDL